MKIFSARVTSICSGSFKVTVDQISIMYFVNVIPSAFSLLLRVHPILTFVLDIVWRVTIVEIGGNMLTFVIKESVNESHSAYVSYCM